MREPPLKIAVLGLDEMGQLLLEAAKGLDYLTIAAVADSDATLAQQTGKSWNCPAYDDYRQLIIANQLDCLLVAAPIHTCSEYLNMALKKKFNILKLPPLARNFNEATELSRIAETEGVILTVANPGRFAEPALAMRNFILQNSTEQIFFVLAAGSRGITGKPQPTWRNDPVLAGGGAILYDCWEIIDQIVWNFGMPQQVYCPVLSAVEGVAGSTGPDRQQRLYLAEDSAAVTVKFSDTLSAGILAGKAADSFGKEPQKWLIAQGPDTLTKFDDKHFEIIDSQGNLLQKENFYDDYPGRIKRVLENFGSNLLWPDSNPPVCTASDNLKVMAIIEAAYLSVRTGMPEEPGKILKIS